MSDTTTQADDTTAAEQAPVTESSAAETQASPAPAEATPEADLTVEKVDPAEGIAPPALAPVVAQEPKTVGDGELVTREGDARIVSGTVPAQVTQPREPEAATVQVHEVYVTTDTVITDTSDPLAVQIPDAGRGSLDLPIHGLGRGSVEDVFAKANADAERDDS